jgi:hypothetical protein
MGDPAVTTSADMDVSDEERRRRRKAAAQMFEEWLADESGHDERTYPALKAAIEETRRELGARSPFEDENPS